MYREAHTRLSPKTAGWIGCHSDMLIQITLYTMGWSTISPFQVSCDSLRTYLQMHLPKLSVLRMRSALSLNASSDPRPAASRAGLAPEKSRRRYRAVPFRGGRGAGDFAAAKKKEGKKNS